MGSIHLVGQVVSIPVLWLNPEQTSYCLLSNDAGEPLDEHLFIPEANRQDTISLFAEGQPGPYHLTVLTKYTNEEFSLNAFAKVTTILNVQPGLIIESSVSGPTVEPYGISERNTQQIDLSFTDQDQLLFNLLLPPGVSVKRNSFATRKNTGVLKLFEDLERPFYVYLQQRKGADWQYLSFDGYGSYDQSWSLPAIPFLTKDVNIELPFFADWRIDFSAYHPVYGERISLPLLKEGTSAVQGQKLAVMLPTEDELNDFYLYTSTHRKHDWFQHVYRGNELPPSLDRQEYTLEHHFRTNDIYLRIGGPDGYFALRTFRSFVLWDPEEGFVYPEHLVEWAIIGEIPAGGVVDFNIPTFPLNRVREFPQLKQLTGARFQKVEFFYPSKDFPQGQWWSKVGDAEQTLKEIGGCLITHTLERY